MHFLGSYRPVQNVFAVGALPRTPLGELIALSQAPQLKGRGLSAPPQEPLPCCRPAEIPRISALWASGFRPSPNKDMGSVSSQNCCKGFRFAEKVEKQLM